MAQSREPKPQQQVDDKGVLGVFFVATVDKMMQLRRIQSQFKVLTVLNGLFACR